MRHSFLLCGDEVDQNVGTGSSGAMAMFTSPRKDCLLVVRTDIELCLSCCKETIKRVPETQVKKVLQDLVVNSSLDT